MALSNAAVVKAVCDACPQVVYAESPAKPKGYTGHVQHVDGNGREFNASWFACQPGHIGKAAQNALKAAKPVAAGSTPAPVAPAPFEAVPEATEGQDEASEHSWAS